MLVKYYIPVHLVQQKTDELFEVLVTLLTKEGVTKDPIVDQLFEFLAGEENMRTALGWLEQSRIIVQDQDVYELRPKHKHAILKNLFSSRSFT